MFTAIFYILLACATSAALGAYFSQPLKDWVKGVPAELRTELQKAETDALAKIKAAVSKTPTVTAAVPAPAPAPVPPAAG